MKKIGIILINYKDYARRFLNECRDSIRSQSLPAEQFHVYLVDNASSEETLRYLNATYPEASIIPREDGNYCAGNNAGISRAKADGCELFVIANMDTRFEKKWLEELVRVAESDAKIGIAQSKILLYPKTDQEKANPRINSVGNLIHYLGFGFTDGYKDANANLQNNAIDELHGYASGCSLIVKKEVLRKIGGYNSELYMYHDDLELGVRAKLAGYRIVLANRSIVYHKADFQRSVNMVYYMERNRYLFLLYFWRWPHLLILAPIIFLLELGMIGYSILGGWFIAKLKANLYFLKLANWQKVLDKRKHYQAITTKRSNYENIALNMEGLVRFQEIDNIVLRNLGNPLMNLYWQIVKKII